ncbi:MAG: formylmethanofuran--tetrahydromethanopterin N-formyltransferase [Planctomycetes bacterium]|nr:formylmethanofuran--tetrahydromethanopterin N-formyltransferase [Planctomycetota bacterium]
MNIDSTQIVDTFAEAFGLRYGRLVVTAHDQHWLRAAVEAACGYGTSVIGCDAEAGLESPVASDATPDGRIGAAVMFFGFSAEAVAKAVGNRLAQCLLTCPTTAVFDGLPGAADRMPLGDHVRYFGDGFEKSKVVAGRRYWRVPVMDGEFLVEESAGLEKGVGGGNFLVQGETLEATLAAVRRGVDAIAAVPGTITPFPGGAVRSGSKVGSQYAALKASTNEAFSPALAGRVASELHPAAACCIEVVIDGVSEAAVALAMAVGIRAAAGPGIPAIAAGNYGGKLGKFRFRLHDVLRDA